MTELFLLALMWGGVLFWIACSRKESIQMTWLVLVALVLGAGQVAAEEERIVRSAAEVLSFKRHNPCPSTGARRGACPGYQVDHTISLCAGGEDKARNMAWLSAEDHAFKTRIDLRECRKLRRMAETPAR